MVIIFAVTEPLLFQVGQRQMVSYDGKVCEYDSIGNPYTYMGNTLVWKNGRQLAQFGDIATFEYNSNGIRTSKTANGTTTKYYLSGSKILMKIVNLLILS